MSGKCKWADGVDCVKPDGVHELDPCVYDERATYRNATVHILQCRNCGHVEVEWERQPNTVGLLKDGGQMRHELPSGDVETTKWWSDEELEDDE